MVSIILLVPAWLAVSHATALAVAPAPPEAPQVTVEAPVPSGPSRKVAQAPGGARPAPPAAPAPKQGVSPVAPGVSPEVAPVVEKMQAFYERTGGFDTRFEQSHTQAGVPSRFAGSTAQGRMRFRKPEAGSGPMMRWDYDDGRILLLVGDRSFTYDPDTKQAIEYQVDESQLSAAVTFMWGRGRLADEFTIGRAGRDLGGEGVGLELTPRKATGAFARVFLLVDPATGVVRRSIVVHASGSENRLIFQEPRVDTSMAAADFDPKRAFPAGTAITRGTVPVR